MRMCIYACLYVHIHISLRVFPHISLPPSPSLSPSNSMSRNTYIDIDMPMNIHIYIHMYKHVYISISQTSIYVYTHTVCVHICRYLKCANKAPLRPNYNLACVEVAPCIIGNGMLPRLRVAPCGTSGLYKPSSAQIRPQPVHTDCFFTQPRRLYVTCLCSKAGSPSLQLPTFDKSIPFGAGLVPTGCGSRGCVQTILRHFLEVIHNANLAQSFWRCIANGLF